MTKMEFEYLTKQPVHVLIVDDDADSAALIASIFDHLGCHTVCTLTPTDAAKSICARNVDLIILDWILDDHTDAKDVMDKCSAIFTKYGIQMASDSKPKVITYSSLKASEVALLTSPYFTHLDHWQKPIPYLGLLKRTLKVLEEIEN
jgi:CheY-like chemotaxis protein